MRARALLPEHVAEAPELLALACLEPALHTLAVALVVTYPELLNEPGRQRDPPPLAGARRLLQHAHSLGRTINQYRRDLEHARTLCEPEPCYDDLPF